MARFYRPSFSSDPWASLVRQLEQQQQAMSNTKQAAHMQPAQAAVPPGAAPEGAPQRGGPSLAAVLNSSMEEFNQG